MTLEFEIRRLEKRYPLQISRGTSTGSNNLFVLLESEGYQGLGECAPGTGFDDTLAREAQEQIEKFHCSTGIAKSPIENYSLMHLAGIDSSAMAAVDMALWDLLAKRAKMPLFELLGLPLPTVPTSVTIGINPVEIIKERVPEILERTKAKFLKVKLGQQAGIESDKVSYLAAKEASYEFGVSLRVDANGGWNFDDANTMMQWLAKVGCDYVEQPLATGEEHHLLPLFESRCLPIYLDESIRTSADIPKWADRCDGINLKLMKTGGITEALRLVATARSHGLKTMIGCMGESSVAISAGAAIGALFDHIDLDSHLNLMPDPAIGAEFFDGIVQPSDSPGHGARLK